MATEITGVVDSLKLETREGQYGEYTLRKIKVKNTEYSNIMKKDSEEVNQGDNVKVTFEDVEGKEGRTFPRVLAVKKLKETKSKETTIDPFFAKGSGGVGISSINAAFVTEVKPSAFARAPHTTNPPSSKDVSMEVSGLLQSLLNTGDFTNDSDGVANGKKLEAALRTVLDVKRKVAKDYE